MWRAVTLRRFIVRLVPPRYVVWFHGEGMNIVVGPAGHSNLRHADYELFQTVFCLVSLSAAWFGSVSLLKPFL